MTDFSCYILYMYKSRVFLPLKIKKKSSNNDTYLYTVAALPNSVGDNVVFSVISINGGKA